MPKHQVQKLAPATKFLSPEIPIVAVNTFVKLIADNKRSNLRKHKFTVVHDFSFDTKGHNLAVKYLNYDKQLYFNII